MNGARFDRLIRKLNINQKIVLICTISILLSICTFTLINYQQNKSSALAAIDQKLQNAAYGLAGMYDAAYHEQIDGATSIDRSTYEASVRKLSGFASQVGVEYVYSMVEKDDSVFFVTTSVSPEDLKKGELEEFYQYYEEASPSVKETFRTGQVHYESTSDRWGTFRSIMIPFKTPGGRTFVVGADVSLASVEATLTRVLVTSVVAGILIFCLVYFIASYLARRMSRPLSQLSGIIHHLVEHDFEAGPETTAGMAAIAGRTLDEVSVVAGDVRTMLDHIQYLLLSLRQEKSQVEQKVTEATAALESHMNYLAHGVDVILKQMEMFADGDVTVRLEVEKQDEIGRLYDGFNRAVVNIRSMLAQVSSAIYSAASASIQISSSTEELAASVREQSNQTGEVATSIEEMVRTIIENSRNATRASEVAGTAGNKARQGGLVVEQTVEKIREIVDVINNASSTIEHLGESSEKIGNIVSLIGEIADQTNLLSLNAAIEAARAGQEGRGFAVVADEIRKLADRTMAATREIARMITSIQSDTSEAVAAIKHGTEHVEAGMRLAEDAGRTLQDVVQGAEHTIDTVNQIAAANEQQSATSEQISRSVEMISNVARESAIGVDQIAQSAENLSNLTDDLRHLIARFRIEDTRDRTSEPVLAPHWQPN